MLSDFLLATFVERFFLIWLEVHSKEYIAIRGLHPTMVWLTRTSHALVGEWERKRKGRESGREKGTEKRGEGKKCLEDVIRDSNGGIKI